ncbi:MAG: 2-oxoacid:acceptor oxidoreductase family protein [Chloroflexota bacterium]
MVQTVEIRWHGRGGQGTVTAAKILADTCLGSGRHVQAFPEYGPERSGAPLRAYNRISDGEIRMHCPVLYPQVVAVADATLLDSVDVTEGAAEDAAFIINTVKGPAEVRVRLGLRDKQRVYTIDATKIAIDCFGKAMPNSPMLGTICKVTALMSLDSLIEGILRLVKQLPKAVTDGNVEAAKRGYTEAREG